MLDDGCWMVDTGCWILDDVALEAGCGMAGWWILDTGCWILDDGALEARCREDGDAGWGNRKAASYEL